MSELELISVIIPAYNREGYLREAIDSILAQTAGRFEIIVIDDGSTDSTAAIAQSYGDPVQCHSQPNQGIGAALNHGLRLATGEWLAFLDSDDLWAPEKTPIQLAHFARHPQLDLVFGHGTEFISPEIPAGQITLGSRPTDPRPMQSYCALLARREAFLRVGRFDEKLALGQFIDWQARARALGLREDMVTATVLHRRIHGNNTTMRRHADYRDYLKILKDHLDRKRTPSA